MKIAKVKVIGLQRSGTNWLTELIKLNFNVAVYDDPANPFFKHALPGEYQFEEFGSGKLITTEMPLQYIALHHDEFFILIFKPIEKWILSIKNNRVDLHQKRPELFNADNSVNEQKAVEFYKHYHQLWFKVDLPNLMFILYDDLLKNRISWMKWLRESESTSLVPKTGTWKNVNHVPQSKKFTETDRLKYLQS